MKIGTNNNPDIPKIKSVNFSPRVVSNLFPPPFFSSTGLLVSPFRVKVKIKRGIKVEEVILFGALSTKYIKFEVLVLAKISHMSTADNLLLAGEVL